MKHKTIAEEFATSARELAERIGNLRYDELSTLLAQVKLKLNQDGQKDRARLRTQLAIALFQMETAIGEAEKFAREAWQHSRAHM